MRLDAPMMVSGLMDKCRDSRLLRFRKVGFDFKHIEDEELLPLV